MKLFTFLSCHCRRFFKSQRGAVASEYALLASLIALVIIAGVTLFGSNLLNLYNMIAFSF
ncbi:MAG TPA: Flp family type IVb pilin [Planctomycetes bacterium]|nr:Flp family type IVb pilin [Planctomycetaceae bacterium]HIN94725.1 Flp family type IVb pilin [Planctomycetota bacterium]